MNILLLGKDGQVGWELQRSLAPVGHVIPVGRNDVNLEDADGVRNYIRHSRPDIIVNAAGYTAVDKAESEPDKARLVNVTAVGAMADEAQALGALLVHYSTDYVFDGEKKSAYVEDDPVRPLSVYGVTKLEGENAIRQRHDRHMIFRTSWVYAARGRNFARTILRLAREKEQLKVVADQYGAPTSAELIADVTALALYRFIHGTDRNTLTGTYHLVAGGETSWHGYARYVLDMAQQLGVGLRVAPPAVEAIATSDYPLPAARPKNSRLATDKLTNTFGVCVPDWRIQVRRMLDELLTRETA
ncbi:MAG: dTDP-4-dehydrorhamnose reductase [Thiohalomonadaceae bacterium]